MCRKISFELTRREKNKIRLLTEYAECALGMFSVSERRGGCGNGNQHRIDKNYWKRVRRDFQIVLISCRSLQPLPSFIAISQHKSYQKLII